MQKRLRRLLVTTLTAVVLAAGPASLSNAEDEPAEALGSLVAIGHAPSVERLVKEAKALVATRELERTDSTVDLDNGDRYTHYLLGLALARSDDKTALKIVGDAVLMEKPWDHKAFLRMGAAERLGRRAAADGVISKVLERGISRNQDEVRVAASFGAG